MKLIDLIFSLHRREKGDIFKQYLKQTVGQKNLLFRIYAFLDAQILAYQKNDENNISSELPTPVSIYNYLYQPTPAETKLSKQKDASLKVYLSTLTKEVKAFISSLPPKSELESELKKKQILLEWYYTNKELDTFVKTERKTMLEYLENNKVNLDWASDYYRNKHLVEAGYVNYLNEKGVKKGGNTALFNSKQNLDLAWLMQSILHNLAILSNRIGVYSNISKEESILSEKDFLIIAKKTCEIATVYLEKPSKEVASLQLYTTMLKLFLSLFEGETSSSLYETFQRQWATYYTDITFIEKKHLQSLQKNYNIWQIREGNTNCYQNLFAVYAQEIDDKMDGLQFINLLNLGINAEKIIWKNKEISLQKWFDFLYSFVEKWQEEGIYVHLKKLFSAHQKFFLGEYAEAYGLLDGLLKELKVDQIQNDVLNLNIRVLLIKTAFHDFLRKPPNKRTHEYELVGDLLGSFKTMLSSYRKKGRIDIRELNWYKAFNNKLIRIHKNYEEGKLFEGKKKNKSLLQDLKKEKKGIAEKKWLLTILQNT